VDKIAFEEFEQIMECALTGRLDPCIEICFLIDNCIEYQDSWMGKAIDKDTKKDCYWFGLAPDGSQAYEYDTFEDFVNAKVFSKSYSLKEIWTTVSLLSLGGGAVSETLSYFLDM